MRKVILTLIASLLSCSAAQAFWPDATVSSLEVGVGYREDSLKWKTSNHFHNSSSYDYSSYDYGTDNTGINLDNNLRLHSKSKWENLKIWQIEAKGKYVTCDNIYLRARGDYGWITSGKYHASTSFGVDSLYSTGSYSNDYIIGNGIHTNSHRVKGHVYDLDVAIGYQFRLCDDNFGIAPLVGYAWSGQHMKNHRHHHGYYSDDYSYDSSYSDYYSYGSYYDYYSGNNSNHYKYHTRWNGPFVGFDFDYRFGCDWEFFGGYQFHWDHYHAKSDFRTNCGYESDYSEGSHQRAKTAYGHEFNLGLRWLFCDCWDASIEFAHQNKWANHGKTCTKYEETQFGNLRNKCYVSTPIKDIKWCSNKVSISVGMAF